MTDNVVALDHSTEKPGGFDSVRLLAVVSTPEARASIARFLAEHDNIDHELLEPADFAVHDISVHSKSADVVLLEVEDEADANARVDAIRSQDLAESVHVCLLMKSPSRGEIVNLLRRGADDILTTTPSDVELSNTLARAAARQPSIAARPTSNSVKTIVFMHAAGGAGATSLAVNSAIQLQRNAQKFGGDACLIDLDLQFGDADLHLDLPLRSNLVDLVKSPDRLDQQMLEHIMVKGPEGLSVLTAPDSPMPLEAIEKSTVENVLALARRHFRHVIVDMPIALTDWTDAVLRKADVIFLVTQINVLALRTSRRLIDTLQNENLDGLPIVGIANRYPSKGQGRKITIEEAEKTLGIPIQSEVPSDFGLMINALDQGIPASINQQSSKYFKTIDELLSDVNAKPASEKKSAKRKSFLKFGGSDV